MWWLKNEQNLNGNFYDTLENRRIYYLFAYVFQKTNPTNRTWQVDCLFLVIYDYSIASKNVHMMCSNWRTALSGCITLYPLAKKKNVSLIHQQNLKRLNLLLQFGFLSSASKFMISRFTFSHSCDINDHVNMRSEKFTSNKLSISWIKSNQTVRGIRTSSSNTSLSYFQS